MFERFNIYDFYGYFVPGSFGVLITVGFVLYAGSLFPALSISLSGVGLGESVLALLISYLAGHIVQSIAIELDLPKGEERRFSQLFLLGDPIGENRKPYYTDAFRERLISALAGHFRLPALDSTPPPQNTHELAQEYFRLAYDYVIARGWKGYTELYNGLYATYRGFYVLTQLLYILTWVGILGWIIRFAFFSPGPSPTQVGALCILLLLLPASRLARRAFRHRFRSFAQLFVDSIYRGFLNLETQEPSSERRP